MKASGETEKCWARITSILKHSIDPQVDSRRHKIERIGSPPVSCSSFLRNLVICESMVRSLTMRWSSGSGHQILPRVNA